MQGMFDWRKSGNWQLDIYQVVHSARRGPNRSERCQQQRRAQEPRARQNCGIYRATAVSRISESMGVHGRELFSQADKVGFGVQ